MSLLNKFQEWTASHNPKWLALIRVAVGAALLLFGVDFLNNHNKFGDLLTANGFSHYNDIMWNSVPWVHIGGGFLMIIGLFTRFAAFIQMPLLIGSLIFITQKKDLFPSVTNPAITILLLVLLVVFLIEGSGTLSLAHYFKEEQEDEKAEEEAEADTEK